MPLVVRRILVVPGGPVVRGGQVVLGDLVDHEIPVAHARLVNHGGLVVVLVYEILAALLAIGEMDIHEGLAGHETKVVPACGILPVLLTLGTAEFLGDLTGPETLLPIAYAILAEVLALGAH